MLLAILKRLDDVSDEVRVCAAESLEEIALANINDKNKMSGFMEELFSSLVTHMDDGNADFRDKILSKKPSLVK